MIALTYDCYYTTDMTLAGAGKRALLAPGDRYRPGYGQTLICLINLRKHGRTFQGASHAGPCVVGVADEKQDRVSDVASYAMPHQSPSSRARKGYSNISSKHNRASCEVASDSSCAASGGAFLETVVATNRGVMLRGRARRGQSEG